MYTMERYSCRQCQRERKSGDSQRYESQIVRREREKERERERERESLHLSFQN